MKFVFKCFQRLNNTKNSLKITWYENIKQNESTVEALIGSINIDIVWMVIFFCFVDMFFRNL